MTSHLIAVLPLRIPEMILAATTLSVIGLGLQTPVVCKLGVLLADVQNVRTVASAPWLFSTGICVIVGVLCFDFMGDGLHDAADPGSGPGGYPRSMCQGRTPHKGTIPARTYYAFRLLLD